MENTQDLETLIASRMRPCATMPKEEDASKRAKKIGSDRYEKKRKAQGIAQEMGGIARQAEQSLETVQDILFEGGMSKTNHPEFDEVFARIA